MTDQNMDKAVTVVLRSDSEEEGEDEDEVVEVKGAGIVEVIDLCSSSGDYEHEETADLRGFEHLAAMEEAEKFMRRRRRKKKKKRAWKETGPRGSYEYEVLADLKGFEHLAAMMEAERLRKRRKKKRDSAIEAQEKTVNAAEGSSEFVKAKEMTTALETESSLLTEKIVPEIPFVDIVTAESLSNKAARTMMSLETKSFEMQDNIILRKLLRGPRYFDSSASSWNMCHKCHKEDHIVTNCTALQQKKPCFICGDFEHGGKRCKQLRHCLFCQGRGHLAKDFPDKQKGDKVTCPNICLRCGDLDSGHDMMSCKNDYFSDDLKKIKCYACKSFGHLCCIDFPDMNPGQVTCYNCGQNGHLGTACTKSRVCDNCGGEGHFA